MFQGSFRGAVCVSLESMEEDESEQAESPAPPVLPPRQQKAERNAKPQLPQKFKSVSSKFSFENLMKVGTCIFITSFS